MRDESKSIEKSEEQFEQEKVLLHTPIGKAIYGMVVDQYDNKSQWLWDLAVVMTNYINSELARANKQAVLDYILSLGWQDTDSEYVKEVLADADRISNEIEGAK